MVGLVQPFQPTIIDHGIVIEHDMPCAVCLEGHAVYAMQIGVFAPCWACQEEGWRLVKKRSLWERITGRKKPVKRRSDVLRVTLNEESQHG